MSSGSKGPKAIALIPQIENTQVSYDAEAFDNLISGHGTKLIHFRAMRCPIGVSDRNDIHHSAADHKGCSNGFVYHRVGCVTGFFQSNQAGPYMLPEGMLENSSTNVTFQRFYDGTDEPVIIAPFDKFYLADCATQVVTWELVESSVLGLDRAQYPILHVEHLVDSRGVEYQFGVDFDLADGLVRWLTQKRPGFDVKIGRGTIYSIRYRFEPHWYVNRLIHDIRVMAITDPLTFETKQTRLPYCVSMHREFVHIANQRSENGDDSGDSRSSPSGSTLGPR